MIFKTKMTISIVTKSKFVEALPLINRFINTVVLVSSLIVILPSHYGTADKHWAYATVGTILFLYLTRQRDVVNSGRR